MNTKPYADWSFDEVYAHVADSIPELADRWREMESYKFRHGAMFHACWESLCGEAQCGFSCTLAPEGWLVGNDLRRPATAYITEHHAVAAACLLAKGMEVPR